MIYKYFPPNHYSLENLQNDVLFCRHFEDFNDPFEFWSCLLQGIPTLNEVDRFKAACATWGFVDADVLDPPDDWQEYFESLDEAQPDFKLLFDHTRIACFSAAPDNLLMWSHYADGMRGFCIAFDENLILGDDPKDYLTDVEYLDKPPLVDSFVYVVAEDQYDYHLMAIDETKTEMKYFDKKEAWPCQLEDFRRCADEALAFMKSIWRRAFAAKPAEWAYEREIRLLIRAQEGGKQPVSRTYPIESVKQIIIGEKMDKAFRNELTTLIADRFHGVPVREARRLPTSYGLEIS
ncbi:DUF2971 domain-containing protein [Sphingopyxis sp. 113P3]|uniref:DUF2971 domain-containing protein n=1 Tax=Sphingopyxis sp. (strain 113P3) TaxID=292913 RepID=UPI0006AD3D33|nr:DUF2971 domain-containing protein [Sphingopyxis sp. 113P3]